MLKRLKTTTAILASLALIAPANLPAQTAGVAIACADGTTPPCAEGVPEVRLGRDGAVEADPVAEPQTDRTAPVEETLKPEPEPVPAPRQAEPPAAEDIAPKVAPAARADTTEAAPAPAETAAEQVAPEPAPATEAQANPEPAPAAEADTTEAAPVAEEAVETAPEQAETAPETAPAGNQLPDRITAPEIVQPEAPARAETVPDPAPAPQVSETAEMPEVAATPPAALSATEDAGGGEADIETETVTEETARSSDEDFQGRINAEAGAVTAEPDGGLSKFEKALLLGAGALAVGAIVRGNRQVVGTSQDRLVVSGGDGQLQVLKDDNALLRQPGSQIETRSFDDGSTRTVTTRVDGSQVITVRDADLRVVRRILVRPDGTEVTLIDDTLRYEPVDVSRLPPPARDVRADAGEGDLRAALALEGALGRQFSLAQIRQISEVRKLAPAIEVDTITFESGSAAIRPEQARSLTDLGGALARLISDNPNEIFLVEGHTDAVGSASTNLILSDRRAESLALALTEYFDVPPENLVVQGYGESDLRVATDTAERANRRAGVRRITQLMQIAAR